MSNSMNLFSKISVAITMDNEHNVSDCRVVGLSVVLNTKCSCPKIVIISFKINVLETLLKLNVF